MSRTTPKASQASQAAHTSSNDTVEQFEQFSVLSLDWLVRNLQDFQASQLLSIGGANSDLFVEIAPKVLKAQGL